MAALSIPLVIMLIAGLSCFTAPGHSLTVFSPSSCTPSVNCLFYYTWSIPSDDSTVLAFSLQAQSTGWLGVGFSQSGGMANADILMASIDPVLGPVVSNRHAFTEGTPIIGLLMFTCMISSRSDSLIWFVLSFL